MLEQRLGIGVRRLIAGLAATAVLGGGAAAQFTQFSWTFAGDPSGSGDYTETTMHIVGPAFDACTTTDTTASLNTTAPVSGTVSVHYSFENQDGGFGWWLVEHPMYVLNGTQVVVGPLEIFDTWEGDVSFHVMQGDSFGLGVQSTDCSFGPGVLDATGFNFVPDAWVDLGYALAGIAGDPLLVGLGSLVPGTHFDVSLVEAAPVAPAWLLLGYSQLVAPFKGGVLGPLPGLLLPFATSPAGRIVLSGDWPVGVPSGTPLVLQYWIQDAVGPAGWSASNAIATTTP
jgi:hypothetical protein